MPAAGACSADPESGDEPDRPVRSVTTQLVGVNLHQLGNLPALLAGRFPAVDATNEVDVTQNYLTHVGLAKTQAAAVRHSGPDWRPSDCR